MTVDGGRKKGRGKTSKATQKNPFNRQSMDVEGTYMYTNKCGQLFQITVACGEYKNDPDLCLVSEFPIGRYTDAMEEGAVRLIPAPRGTGLVSSPAEPVNDNDGLYFIPNFELPDAGDVVDEGGMFVMPFMTRLGMTDS